MDKIEKREKELDQVAEALNKKEEELKMREEALLRSKEDLARKQQDAIEGASRSRSSSITTSDEYEDDQNLADVLKELKRKKKAKIKAQIEKLRRQLAEDDSDDLGRQPVAESRTEKVSFRDTVDMLPKFKGDKLQSVETWIQGVNRLKDVYGWSQQQTFVAASKALDGVAKVWLADQYEIDSWEKLERELKKEFEKKVSAADIHKLMDKKKRKKEQTTDQFFQEMRKLGRQGCLDEGDVIKYIINGIFEDEAAKVPLIGATTFEDLKQRIENSSWLLRSRKEGSRKKYEGDKNGKKGQSGKTERKSGCYNCGEEGHFGRECPNKDKGPRCFRCNSWGHKSSDCTEDDKKKEVKKDFKKAEKKKQSNSD